MSEPLRPRSWPFWAAAAALGAIVVALLAWGRPPVPGAGFERREFEGGACAGPSKTSVVSEPFLRATEEGDGRCVEWSAQMVAWTKMRARVEMTSEPGGTVSIDGRPVAFDQAAHPARTRSGTVELGRGVHAFVVQHPGEKGAAYLRVALADELAPHNFEFAPPLDADAFFTSVEAASRALQGRTIEPAGGETPSSDRPSWPAYAGCLALTGAAGLVWLALRRRRGRAPPWLDVAIGGALFAVALVVRARGIALEDDTWDELIYVDTAAHWLHNLALGDFHPEAWRFSLTHPPDTKWALAFGVALDGHTGARIVAATESALAVALLFAFGRVAFDRAVGAVAGGLALFLPLWVAHGRIAGHESHVILWWTASMLGLACWLRSLERGAATVETPVEKGDPLAAFACVFAATIGLWSKANVVWLFPLLGVALLLRARRSLARGVLPVPLAAIGGGLAATVLTFAAWPYLRMRPYEQATQLAWLIGPGKPTGDIEVYLGKLTMPAWHYFAFSFVAETPALLLVAAAAGAVLALASPAKRPWGLVGAMWLVFPFGQSLSTVRVGAGRYVIQAWPALLLFAAIALVALGELAANLAFARGAWARRALRASPAVLAIAYTWAALARIEPYPLDYFDELVGGAAGVAAKRTFEVPWWGEGNLAAVRALDEKAPPGARVFLALWPKHVVARLRDDLVPVSDRASADYVLVSHLQYFEQPPPPQANCTLESSVQAAGAPLVDTYRCSPVNPVQLGFAAMGRNATEEALGHFREALQRDPHDPAGLFGMGWAAQVKGDLHQAEVLYVQAALRAAQAGDAETEYFARFDVGTIYAQQGKNDQAVDAFRAALVVTDRAPARFADRTWTVWLNLGRALAAAGRETEAREALDRASSLRPDDPAIVEARKLLGSPRDGGTSEAGRVDAARRR